MKSNEEKQNYTGEALDKIEPVSRVRVIQVIRPRFHGDHQPIDGVIDERYKDSADLDEEDVRDRLKVLNSVIEVCRASERF